MAAVPAAGEHEKKLRMMRSPLVQNAELTSRKTKSPGDAGAGEIMRLGANR